MLQICKYVNSYFDTSMFVKFIYTILIFKYHLSVLLIIICVFLFLCHNQMVFLEIVRRIHNTQKKFEVVPVVMVKIALIINISKTRRSVPVLNRCLNLIRWKKHKNFLIHVNSIIFIVFAIFRSKMLYLIFKQNVLLMKHVNITIIVLIKYR